MDTRRLGRTDIEITPIGLGCMPLSGDGGVASRVFAPTTGEAATTVVRTALEGGISWFDTAEMYGRGASERALTTGLAASGVGPGEVVVATKWAPLGRTWRNIERTVDARLAALQGYPIDLYQIHEPWSSLSTIRPQLRAMARLQRAGRIRAVGVSNFGARQMRIAHETLRAEGIVLASNQVHISLLHRSIEANGVLDAARGLGITLIAYSPLEGGLLTGRFHDDPAQVAVLRPMRRYARGGLFSARGLARTAPLVDGLRAVAAAHEVTVSQIALAWLTTFYGQTVVAIPGASRPRQAAEAAEAMSIRPSTAELARLDELSRPLT